MSGMNWLRLGQWPAFFLNIVMNPLKLRFYSRRDSILGSTIWTQYTVKDLSYVHFYL